MKTFTSRMFLLAAVLLSSLDAFPGNGNGETLPEKPPIVTPTLRIGWSSGRVEPSEWKVFARNGGSSDRWHKMISLSERGEPLSRHLRMQGFIHGQSLIQGQEGKEGVQVVQEIEKSDHPYCISVRITIRNAGCGRFVPLPSDNLWISLGPGIGQAAADRDTGTPAAASATGIAGCIDGNVELIREDHAATGTAGWKSPGLHWAGIEDRYFAMVVIPIATPGKQACLPFIGTHVSFGPGRLPAVSFRLPLASLEPGMTTGWEFLVFSGPKSEAVLSSAPANLDKLLFSGMWNWMRWLCFGLMWMLVSIHFFIPGWGWSIIVLALIVRLLLYPLAKKALVSQRRFVAAQKEMMPELSEIKRKWKGGEQSERILRLYKKHNVSPFAGLKPLLIVLIQIPVLIALYQVLGTAYELRDAGFLWIGSLAEPDRLFSFGFRIPFLGEYFNVLPVLMAVVTLLSFRLTPAPSADEKSKITQNLFLGAMTLAFFLLFYSFPSGMVLYWTFANIFHIVQHRMMIRRP